MRRRSRVEEALRQELHARCKEAEYELVDERMGDILLLSRALEVLRAMVENLSGGLALVTAARVRVGRRFPVD